MFRLAFECIHKYKPIWGFDLKLMPFFLGGVMNLSGNKPPATLLLKGVYMNKELTYLSKLHNVELNFPNNFPENSIKAMRVLTALRLKEPQYVESASRAFWHIYWRDQKSFQNDDDLIQYLTPILQKEKATAYVKQASQLPAVKEELTKVTTYAVEELGAFGAPWILIEMPDGSSHSFFGSDRMECVADVLGKKYLGLNPVVGGGIQVSTVPFSPVSLGFSHPTTSHRDPPLERPTPGFIAVINSPPPPPPTTPSTMFNSNNNSKHHDEEEGAQSSSAAVWDDDTTTGSSNTQQVPPPHAAIPIGKAGSTIPNSALNETSPLLANGGAGGQQYPSISNDNQAGQESAGPLKDFQHAVAGAYHRANEAIAPVREQAEVQANVAKAWMADRWEMLKAQAVEKNALLKKQYNELVKYYEDSLTVEQKRIVIIAAVAAGAWIIFYFFALFFIYHPPHHAPGTPPPDSRLPPSQPDMPIPPPPESDPTPEPSVLCTSPDCVITSANLLQSMDFTVDPGNFEARHPIPAQEASVSGMTLIAKMNTETIKSIMVSPYPTKSRYVAFNDNDLDRETFNKVQTLYKSCMDEKTADSLGAKPLTALLSESLVAHLPIVYPTFPSGTFEVNLDNLAKSLYGLQSYSVVPFFMAGAAPSPTVKGKNMVTLIPFGHLSLKIKQLYDNQKLLDTFGKVVEEALPLVLGSTSFGKRSDWKEFAGKVVEFEKKLAGMSPDITEIMETMAATARLRDLEESAYYIPWSTLLKLHFPTLDLHPDMEIGVIGGMSYYQDVAALIGTSGLDVVEGYLAVRGILTFEEFSGATVRKVLAPLQELLTGVSAKNEKARADVCAEVVKNNMDFALGRFFVQKVFGGDSVKSANVMMDGISQAFSDKLGTYEWLDANTRAEAQAKIENLLVTVGYPTFILNSTLLADYYRDVEPSAGEFFKTIVELKKVAYRDDISQIDKPVDRNRLGMPISEVN
ncbi:hypothetical protein HDU76_005396, partial [Blyttiomyces sp. JEL0837]